MTHPHGPLLVLGLGNVLLRDEGVGVHVVRALQGMVERGDVELPAETRVLDGGTMGLGLLPLISDARAVLLVDAMDGGRAPGAVEVIRGDALLGADAGHIAPQPVGVGDLLGTARLAGDLPAAVSLVGIQPSEIAIGLELSEAVRAAVPIAVATIMGEVRGLDAIAGAGVPGLAAGAGDRRGASS